MNPADYRVRRATLDDLPALQALRQSMQPPPDNLEKRLTEFQVLEDQSGQIIGAVGFCIHQRQGLIHSEGFSDPSLAIKLRPLFWTRVQSLTLNHGIARIWTRETDAYWLNNGFRPATEDVMPRLPPHWAFEKPDGWSTLQLKDEAAVASMEKEIDAWMSAEKQRTAQMFESAKVFKVIVLSVLTIAFLAVVYFLFRHSPQLQQMFQSRPPR